MKECTEKKKRILKIIKESAKNVSGLPKDQKALLDKILATAEDKLQLETSKGQKGANATEQKILVRILYHLILYSRNLPRR